MTTTTTTSLEAVLEAIYRNVPSDLFVIEWSSSASEGGKSRTNAHTNIHSLAEQIRASNAKKRNTYIGTSPLHTKPKGSARGSLKDVGCTVAFWIDFDLGTRSDTGKKYVPTKEEAFEIVEKCYPEMPPTLALSTGNGLHLWWLFEEPNVFRFDEKARERAAELSTRFQYTIINEVYSRGYVIDVTADLPRVLRVPETMNWKDREHPKPVEVEYFNPSRRYKPNDFLPHMVEEVPLRTPNLKNLTAYTHIMIPEKGKSPSEKLVRLLNKDSRAMESARGEYRKELKDNTGSGHDFALLNFMFLEGFTPQEAVDALVAVNEFYRLEPKDKPPVYYLHSMAKVHLEYQEREKVPEVVDKKEALENLRKVLGLAIEGLIQVGNNKAVYVILFEGEERVTVGTTAIMTTRSKFCQRMFETTGQYPNISIERWPTVLRWFSAIRELHEPQNEVHEAEDILTGYLASVKVQTDPDRKMQAIHSEEPYVFEDKLWVYPPSIRKYVQDTLRENVEINEIRSLLKTIGFKSKNRPIRKEEGVTSITYWYGPIPEGVL